MRVQAVLSLLALAAATGASGQQQVCSDGGGVCLEATVIDAGTAIRVRVLEGGSERFSGTVDASDEGETRCFGSVATCTGCLVFDTVDLSVSSSSARVCAHVELACVFTGFNVTLPCIDLDTMFDRTALPPLADEFAAEIEANLAEWNATFTMREYFDAENDRVRQELHRGGEAVVHIIDVAATRFYSVVGGACEVRNLTGARGPGSHVVDPETGRLRSAREMFESFSTSAYAYAGEDEARGIPTDKWAAQVSHERERRGQTVGINYTLEWHFAQPSWSWRGSANHRLPIRAVLVGTEHNVTAGGAWSAAVREFNHVYEWVSYRPGRPAAALFAVPEDVRCVDLAQPPIPRLDSSWSVVVESTHPGRMRTETFGEAYDYERNWARIDYPGAGTGSAVSDYLDGETGIVFRVVRQTTGVYGSVVGCERRQADGQAGELWNPRERHLRRVVPGYQPNSLTGEVEEYAHVGQRHARGILCDVWSSEYAAEYAGEGGRRYALNMTEDYYFSAAPWRLSLDVSAAQGAAAANGTVDGAAQHTIVHSRVVGSASLVNGDDVFHFGAEMSYLDVQMGAPDATYFDVPAECGDVRSASGRDEEDGFSDGAVAGMAVVFLAVGALLGGAVFWRHDRDKYRGSAGQSDALTAEH